MSSQICALPECRRTARFFMYWENQDGKHCGLICASHDQRIGRRNLIDAGIMTHSEAVLFERYTKETEFDEHPIEWEEWLRIYYATRPARKRAQSD